MDTQTLARATEPFFTTKGVGKGTHWFRLVHGARYYRTVRWQAETA
ncbi:MAG: hypothetical protein ACJARL_002106 [Halopseudomonas sp.]|jgi:hypothetical protein